VGDPVPVDEELRRSERVGAEDVEPAVARVRRSQAHRVEDLLNARPDALLARAAGGARRSCGSYEIEQVGTFGFVELQGAGVTFARRDTRNSRMSTIDALTSFDGSNDIRSTIPRFEPEALKHNQAFLDLLTTVAERKGATPGQIALAWLLAQRPWIVPIPGTRKAHRLAENIGAADVELAADELSEIENAAAKIRVAGGRYSEAAEAMTNLETRTSGRYVLQPAKGTKAMHDQELADLMDETFQEMSPHSPFTSQRVHAAPRFGGPVVITWPSGSVRASCRFGPNDTSHPWWWIF
jgi:Aldo/keto reductase family